MANYSLLLQEARSERRAGPSSWSNPACSIQQQLLARATTASTTQSADSTAAMQSAKKQVVADSAICFRKRDMPQRSPSLQPSTSLPSVGSTPVSLNLLALDAEADAGPVAGREGSGIVEFAIAAHTVLLVVALVNAHASTLARVALFVLVFSHPAALCFVCQWLRWQLRRPDESAVLRCANVECAKRMRPGRDVYLAFDKAYCSTRCRVNAHCVHPASDAAEGGARERRTKRL